MILKLVEEFPNLVPSIDMKIWNGTIFAGNEEVPVSISTPLFPSLNSFSLISTASMEKCIRSKLNEFLKKAEDRDFNLLHLLKYLRINDSQLDRNYLNTDQINESLSVKMDYYLYKQILRDLRLLNGENVVMCNWDLTEITLKATDMTGDDHKLVLRLPSDYPTGRPVVLDADLPQVAMAELAEGKNIVEIFKLFQGMMESYQDFWNVYKSLTKNTWLIDPEHPTFKDTYCRIMIGDNVSMLITLNPQDVHTCPDIKFLGPEVVVTPFINSMERKLKTNGWDEDSGMLDNLLSLLNLSQFPLPENESEAQRLQGECSICFMVRLDDQTLPTKVCNNPKCDSNFHISCLAQWFQAVPTNETSFNLISGDCPCCAEKILCPIKVS